MADLFNVLIPVALIVVFGVLCFGVYAMFRGGDFGRSIHPFYFLWFRSSSFSLIRFALPFIFSVSMLGGAGLAAGVPARRPAPLPHPPPS